MANAISLNPETFNEGGAGLIDDVDLVVKSARFGMFEYGKTGKRPALLFTFTTDEGESLEEPYSVGKKEDWMPSDDGKQLLAVGASTSLHVSSKAGMFFKSLVEIGFPGEKLGDDISILDGLKAHFIRVPDPERKGLTKSKEQLEKEAKYGPPTTLLPSAIVSLPWEKTKPVGAPKAAGKPKAAAKKAEEAAPAEESADIEVNATDAVLAVLTDAGGELKITQLPGKILAKLREMGVPEQTPTLRKAVDAEFLKTGPWVYDGSTVKLG